MPTEPNPAAQPAAPTAPAIKSAIPLPTPRDAMVAAAAKAMESVGTKPQAETHDAHGNEVPEAETKPQVAESAELAATEAETAPEVVAKEAPKVPNLLQRLREREESYKLKQQEKGRNEPRRDYEVERMRSEAARELEQARMERARIEKLRSDPFEAIKELGWNTQDLVNGVVKRGTPEYEAQQKLIAIQAEADKRIAKLDELTKAHEEREQKSQANLKAMQRENAEKVFLANATDEENFTALNTLYKPDEILDMAYKIQREYSRRTGDVASDADLAEYMNAQAQERLEKIRQTLGGSGIAPKVDKAKGSRALSNTAASEARSAPKPMNRASTEERLAAMARAAAEAMRQRV